MKYDVNINTSVYIYICIHEKITQKFINGIVKNLINIGDIYTYT